ncbi:MAG: hypothetical protein QOF76_3550, partial [Solirubrobacteraceae bacterium]|nr:hypothetical protein [Solirubrobacteraceae bacterium]
MTTILTDRALNRATLARQALLEPADVGAADLIARFAGLQAQDVTTPYVTLWTRLARFVPEDLQGLLETGAVLRVPLWRNTIHHVTAADFERFYALSREGGNYRPKIVRDLPDPDGVATAARALLADEPRNMAALGRALAEHFPGEDEFALAYAARRALPFRHLPPCGFWMRGAAPLIGLWDGVGTELEREALVRRYLAAFGPASVADAQYFAGVTRLGPTFAALREELVTFENERGVE